MISFPNNTFTVSRKETGAKEQWDKWVQKFWSNGSVPHVNKSLS